MHMSVRRPYWIAAAFGVGWLGCALATAQTRPATAPPACAVLLHEDASWHEQFAAAELRRYLFARTGALLPVATRPDGTLRAAIVIATPSHAATLAWLNERAARTTDAAALDKLTAARAPLEPEQYRLTTVTLGESRILLVVGAHGSGVLYGAYRVAEHLGVRFYLHGDVLPDERMPFALPTLNETGRPLFALRGIQPFHDFPEGPDWWSADDYKAVVAQLPKLRMNFIGLHTYPEGGPNAEPTVWIGLPSEFDQEGRVGASYPASYQSTLRGNWGYAPKRVSQYRYGASQVFDRDDYAGDVMRDLCPQPLTPDECNALFNRTADLLRDVFTYARQRGVKTCVGTETPLTIPARVQDRLQAQGRDPTDPQVLRQLYAGMYERIARAYPLDYYWLWTPEGWTWEGTREEQVQATLADLQAAIAAHGPERPFKLATCGWVLGPPDDRALFDELLPKNVALSCINRQVGMEPVEPGFAQVVGREKWAIPWLEDDQALTAPQLWAGRMRADAADARRYGCTGLMGIHWRTRNVAPMVAALAHAAWEQPWATDAAAQPAVVEGPLGGNVAAFYDHPIADTADDPLYQTVRWGVEGYRFAVPNGTYRVTLKFCEPHYSAAGQRVFDVRLQGDVRIAGLDIFARVGRNRALDFTFDDVRVTDGVLALEFGKQVEHPAIAALAIEGSDVARRVNCGGAAYKDYAADWPAGGRPDRPGLQTDDFYRDWALAEFGPDAGPPAAAIFARIDGRLPRPVGWINGPGGLKPDSRPWAEVAKEYAFVDELAALRGKAKSLGYADRLEYWVHQFAYLRATAALGCALARQNDAFAAVRTSTGDGDRARDQIITAALDAHREVLDKLRGVYFHLLMGLSTPGEMGTIANWEQHILPDLVERPAEILRSARGQELPQGFALDRSYFGLPRLFLPTARTSIAAGETLVLHPIVLAPGRWPAIMLRWRLAGETEWQTVPCTRSIRGVYAVELPFAGRGGELLEYYLEAPLEQPDGMHAAPPFLRFPPTAPELNATVVVEPPLK